MCGRAPTELTRTASPGTSSLTILLLDDNDTFYANNSDGNWYSWNNGWGSVAGDPRGGSSNSVSPNSVSPSGTTIPVSAQIVDGAANVWMRSGGIFYENGIARTSSRPSCCFITMTRFTQTTRTAIGIHGTTAGDPLRAIREGVSSDSVLSDWSRWAGRRSRLCPGGLRVRSPLQAAPWETSPLCKRRSPCKRPRQGPPSISVPTSPRFPR